MMVALPFKNREEYNRYKREYYKRGRLEFSRLKLENAELKKRIKELEDWKLAYHLNLTPKITE